MIVIASMQIRLSAAELICLERNVRSRTLQVVDLGDTPQLFIVRVVAVRIDGSPLRPQNIDDVVVRTSHDRCGVYLGTCENEQHPFVGMCWVDDSAWKRGLERERLTVLLGLPVSSHTTM